MTWRADRRSGVRAALATSLLAMLWAAPAQGQRLQAPSWLTLDTSADVNRSVDASGTTTGGAIFDAYIAVRLAPGLEIAARPWTQRQASGEWNRQLWLAAVRYERKGPLGVRVEGGLIPSPVGLSNLFLRPHLNPTVAQPSSLFQALPPPEPGSPRLTLLGAVYPLGVSTTVSGTHWDVRGALIDTSPVRTRRIFGDATNPPRFPNVVVGGGVTPVVGLRIGGSVTRGAWRRADEVPFSESDRMATVVTVEAEWSFRFTKLVGEWTRDTLETNTGDEVESGWYIQGQQTLTPRWFVAARVERLEGPPLLIAPQGPRQTFAGAEETIGFRITPEITLRASYRARRLFSQPDFLHQAMASVVWARRWF
jgi:hypothetical protein